MKYFSVKSPIIWIFFIAISLPGLQMATNFVQDAEIIENRKLATIPNQDFGFFDLHELSKKVIPWFNDHYGFRGFLIRVKDSVDYQIFNFSSKIYVGKDGWLYYRSVLDNEKPHVDRYLSAHHDQVIAGIKAFSADLQARGVPLLVMIPPMKDISYPQYLPAIERPISRPSQVDLLLQTLKNTPNVQFVDAIPPLRKAAGEYQVFHKTDFHWNDPGAYAVAQALVNRVALIQGVKTPVWDHPLQIESRPYTGGESRFMPIFPKPISEIGFFVKPTWTEAQNCNPDHRLSDVFIFEVFCNKNALLKPIALIGDSFADGMIRAGLAPYFQKLYKVSVNRVSLNRVANDLPPDTGYVLLEFIEVSTGMFEQLANYKN